MTAHDDCEKEWSRYYGLDDIKKYRCPDPECGCVQEYVEDGKCCRCGWIMEWKCD